MIEKFRERYSHVHPLIFLRTIERARTAGDAFDIFETIPDRWPLVWDEEARRWVHTEDMLQSKKFDAS